MSGAVPQTAQQRETAARREVHIAVRHSVVYGLGTLLIRAVAFLMLPVYTRYLLPVDYGVLEVLDRSMSLLGMLVNIGITPALLRYYTMAETEEEKKRVVSTALVFVTAAGVAMFALAGGIIHPLSAVLLGPAIPARYFFLSFSSFVLGFIGDVPRAYLRGREASGVFVLLEIVSASVLIALNVVFIVVLQIGAAGILLSALLVNTAGLAVYAWTARQVGFGFSGRLLRQMAGFGVPLILSNCGLFILNFSDRYFLQHLRSLDEVGIYAVGYKFGFMVSLLLVQPFYVMWQTRMYMIHRQPDHAAIFGRLFVLFSIVLAYAGLALSMLSPEIVRLMVSSNFAAAQIVVPPVALAYVLYGLTYYVQVGMYLSRKTLAIGVISAAGAVLNLGLNFYLIGRFGMRGAAWATAISFLAIAAASYWKSQRAFPLPLAVGRVATSITIAIAFYLISDRLQSPSMAFTLSVKAALLASFPFLLWKTGLVSHSEAETVIAGMNGLRVKLSNVLSLGRRPVVTL